ncbi:hypothetical protein CFP56_003085 [Quercus suber]|uniref:DC1 domain-containing protein n=1 Tax=Quercus suber TaxID=58331 RepID=A0AAW0IJR2_QUESU
MEQQQLLHFSHSKHPLVYVQHFREVPLGLHHPLHPLHPLILFDEKTGYLEKENSTCQVCNESRNEYTYRCYHCDFNLHIKCAILQLEAEFHDHPLTPIGKIITFTCDICGKEGKEPLERPNVPIVSNHSTAKHRVADQQLKNVVWLCRGSWWASRLQFVKERAWLQDALWLRY